MQNVQLILINEQKTDEYKSPSCKSYTYFGLLRQIVSLRQCGASRSVYGAFTSSVVKLKREMLSRAQD